MYRYDCALHPTGGLQEFFSQLTLQIENSSSFSAIMYVPCRIGLGLLLSAPNRLIYLSNRNAHHEQIIIIIIFCNIVW